MVSLMLRWSRLQSSSSCSAIASSSRLSTIALIASNMCVPWEYTRGTCAAPQATCHWISGRDAWRSDPSRTIWENEEQRKRGHWRLNFIKRIVWVVYGCVSEAEVTQTDWGVTKAISCTYARRRPPAVFATLVLITSAHVLFTACSSASVSPIVFAIWTLLRYDYNCLGTI